MCVQVPCVYIPHTASSVTAWNNYFGSGEDDLQPRSILGDTRRVKFLIEYLGRFEFIFFKIIWGGKWTRESFLWKKNCQKSHASVSLSRFCTQKKVQKIVLETCSFLKCKFWAAVLKKNLRYSNVRKREQNQKYATF